MFFASEWTNCATESADFPLSRGHRITQSEHADLPDFQHEARRWDHEGDLSASSRPDQGRPAGGKPLGSYVSATMFTQSTMRVNFRTPTERVHTKDGTKRELFGTANEKHCLLYESKLMNDLGSPYCDVRSGDSQVRSVNDERKGRSKVPDPPKYWIAEFFAERPSQIR